MLGDNRASEHGESSSLSFMWMIIGRVRACMWVIIGPVKESYVGDNRASEGCYG